MRVIICGAGQVGYSIAAYLAREGNDVTVIDNSPHVIDRINNDLDVNGILGHAPNPETLSQAGAGEADLIVAVTQHDEVNMIACQVAHSLFNVPKKIARVREQDYLAPAWANLFSRSHLPIDKIISPELEVARAANQRLRTPGTTNVYTLADGAVHLTGVICTDCCPVINTQLRQLPTLFPNLPIVVCLIIRGSEIIVPNENDQMLAGDLVYFFTDADHLKRAMAAFGHEEQEARNIVIMGGGNIGLSLAKLILDEHIGVNLKIIETSAARAQYLSEMLPSVVVIHGDGLQNDIIQEVNMAKTETMIAVTNDDETNILGSLLAKQHGCERVITLMNNPNYTSLVTPLGIDATVSPRSSTVSTIMQHVRRGRIKALHAIHDGEAEIIEAEVPETSNLVNMSFADLELPKDVVVGMVVREDGTVILPTPECVIQPLDHVIMMARAGQAQKVEKLFTIQVDLF